MPRSQRLPEAEVLIGVRYFWVWRNRRIRLPDSNEKKRHISAGSAAQEKLHRSGGMTGNNMNFLKIHDLQDCISMI